MTVASNETFTGGQSINDYSRNQTEMSCLRLDLIDVIGRLLITVLGSKF